VEKGPDAFRTISEVAEDLDLPQHVLRFWETRFGQIKPLKRGGGRRYYRPDDVDLLRGIRHLLYGEGYTIRGVQQILREQGLRHVQAIGQSAAEEAAKSGGALPDSPRERAGEGGRISGLMDLIPSLRATPRKPELPRVVNVPVPPRDPAPDVTEEQLPQFLRKPSAARGPMPTPTAREDAGSTSAAWPAGATKLTPDGVKLLKATLNELGECRRMLDAAREREW
jgi:DNA-binding transcriptional MerR regulator